MNTTRDYPKKVHTINPVFTILKKTKPYTKTIATKVGLNKFSCIQREKGCK